MTRTELKSQIDQLGRIRGRITELKSAERELSDGVRAGLEAAELERLAGGDFSAELLGSRRLEVDPRKFRRHVDREGNGGDKVFWACARIDLKAARRHFPDGGLDKLGTLVHSFRLKVSPIG